MAAPGYAPVNLISCYNCLTWSPLFRVAVFAAAAAPAAATAPPVKETSLTNPRFFLMDYE